MQRTIAPTKKEELIAMLLQAMRTAATQLVQWVEAEQEDWHDLEAAVRRLGQELCVQMLSGVATALTPPYPVPQMGCACGAQADYQCTRSAQVQSVFGVVHYARPYYLCAHCHQGSHPLDTDLGWCAGSISTGLQELIALLGGQHPFGEAATWIERLLLIAVSPTLCQQVTEAVGQQILAADAEVEMERPPVPSAAPLGVAYISMDGAIAAIRGEGWKEGRIGTVYTTAPVYTKRGLEPHAVGHSYVADFLEVGAFGTLLASEGTRRQLDQAQQVVVIGDGAHWIWHLAQEHWPQAVQIVDWYHATEYVWAAAHAISDQPPAAAAWANARCTELWEGDVHLVIDRLHDWSWKYPAADKAETYFLNNRHRMRYPAYRAAGLQIGSGSIESACKHVLQARLKGAGMRWSRPGARAILALRARLRSGRWEETRTHLCPPTRSYHRKVA